MMLLDSNVIIYAAQPQHAALRQFIAQHTPAVSVISYIEVLGFHRLHESERNLLERFFSVTEIIPLTDPVVLQAVELRQQRKMSLGDSIIAATALVHHHSLITHNAEDFRWISDLSVMDPLDQLP